MLKVLAVLVMLALPSLALSQTEAEVEALLCADMETSYRIPIGSVSYLEVDCVSDTHAIEIDWNDKWREGVGQALVYSKLLDLKFGLILVCKENSTKEHLCYRHSRLCYRHGRPRWTAWS